MFDLEDLLSKLSPESALEELSERFLTSLEDEMTEKFLEALLFCMKVKFLVDPDYRKNIENFRGSYQFRAGNEGVNVQVDFADGKMLISENLAPAAHVEVSFKNSRGLRNFLLSQKKDILQCLLNHEVTVTGNFNYLYKFGFMANHLQLELARNLP